MCFICDVTVDYNKLSMFGIQTLVFIRNLLAIFKYFYAYRE